MAVRPTPSWRPAVRRFQPKSPKNPQLARNFRPLAVSVPDTGALLSLSKSKIYALLRKHELDRVKDGKKTTITYDSIESYVDRHTVRPEAAE
jgi:excisionase family DNA binding protein